jgi:hypothetical protein
MDIVKLHNLAISDTGFIFDPVTGNSFNTNETGIFILNRLKRGDEVTAIAGALNAEYDTDIETAEQDVLQLIETLRSYYLI